MPSWPKRKWGVLVNYRNKIIETSIYVNDLCGAIQYIYALQHPSIVLTPWFNIKMWPGNLLYFRNQYGFVMRNERIEVCSLQAPVNEIWPLTGKSILRYGVRFDGNRFKYKIANLNGVLFEIAK